MTDVYDRLAEYCLHCGVYNQELMQHEKVRDLLIDCRAEIARLRLTDAERAAVEKAAATAQEAVDKKLLGWEDDAATAATLRGLLERLGGER